MTRPARVAGAFYAGNQQSLRAEIEVCFTSELGPGSLPEIRSPREGKTLGLVCPHAGLIYSGPAAAHAYGALAEDGIPDLAVLIGPNHYSLGQPVAVAVEDEWTTPLGAVPIDRDTADAIVHASSAARADDLAHSREHSLEVQLPFLQYISGSSLSIVPIAIARLSDHDALYAAEDLGAAIAGALQGKSAVVIASTDFSHYVSSTTARQFDSLALEQILRLDPQGLLETVRANSISMCGAVGAAAMLVACSRLGAVTARQLTYYSSGAVTGDMAEVVGYAAVAIERA